MEHDKEPRKIGWLARLVRWLSAWAWTQESECLTRASFTVALANQQLNAMTLNTHQLELRESLWIAILGTAEHCIDGSEFSPPNVRALAPRK
jgi:hypothetical protein